MSNKYTNKKIKELEQEIKKLKQSLDVCIELNEGLDKERTSYRRIIKLMLLMNLISSSSTDTDIDRIVKRNIQEYYRSMNNDLMQMPTNDKDEFDDEEREYNDDESIDLWYGEEEYE